MSLMEYYDFLLENGYKEEARTLLFLYGECGEPAADLVKLTFKLIEEGALPKMN